MTYERLVQESARWHLDHLQKQLDTITTSEVCVLVNAIIEMTSAALVQRASMVGPTSVTIACVRSALDADFDATLTTLNEHALGLGCETPIAVFVGKEHAYDGKTEPVNFLVEAVALTTLWLTRSPDLLRALLEEPSLLNVDVLRYPAALPAGSFQSVERKAGHTWRKIARVMQKHLGMPVTYETWGDYAYLVELNAVPSKNHVGLAPSRDRIRFLCDLGRVSRRGGTRTMVLHSQERHHRSAQASMTAAFLGVDETVLPSLLRIARDGATQGRRIEAWEHGGARVLRCRQLGNSVGDDLLDDLGGLLLPRSESRG